MCTSAECQPKAQFSALSECCVESRLAALATSRVVPVIKSDRNTPHQFGLLAQMAPSLFAVEPLEIFKSCLAQIQTAKVILHAAINRVRSGTHTIHKHSKQCHFWKTNHV